MKICGKQSQTMRTKYQSFVIKNCNKETGSGQWDSGCCRSFAVCRKIRLKGISIDKHFGQGKSPFCRRRERQRKEMVKASPIGL